MQNWNQWQLSAGTAATSMPQPPVGYAAPGGDPMATMQAYMQYYNQPAPTGYTTEQWTAAQQQNWAQWQQWQQQYQQWQAQYGEKYQETVKHMSAQNIGLANQVPPLPIVQPPPLPKEEIKPPLPPNPTGTYQFANMPPPHQNNLPLFPAKEGPQNPPLPPSQPPLPPESSSNRKDNVLTGKRSSSTLSESSSAKKLKHEDEELTEAEKTFDAQFKQWEEQFNKWKQQNANHPDKTQYKQYEAKWTSWREKLIERREQMRRKREQQKQAAAKAEAEKNKNLPGDDKILNILSSTENQGLINNLLGIGKTLGLTGKQNTNVPPPPPPPPPSTETTTSNVETITVASTSQMTSMPTPSQVSTVNQMSSNMASSWNAQHWASQYNAGMNMSNFPAYQSAAGVPPPPYGAPPNTQLPPPNFTQPPPSFSNTSPNFSQPPPGFPGNDVQQSQNPNANRPSTQPGLQGRPSFAPNDSLGPNANLRSNDRQGQSGPMSNYDATGQPSGNMGMNEQNRQKDAIPSLRYGNKNFSDQQGNQFRPSDPFRPRTDERLPETEPFRREERNYQEQGSNQFNLQKTNFGSMNDRFPGPGNDRFGQGSDLCAPTGDRFGQGGDRFGSGGDRFGAANNRFVPGNDRFGQSNDRFGSGDDRFGSRTDRFGPGSDRVGQGNDRNESNNDRFPAPSDRFGSKNNEHFGSGGDRFNRNSFDRFDATDGGDSRRDSFSNNPRNFNRNNQFEPQDKFAPELKKLMEKRRAAMNVFKPSYLDNDKNVGVGSLSESFKRIAGDSPFIPKSFMDSPRGGNNFGPRAPFNFNAGPGNFRMSGDFKPQGGSEFEPRGPPGFGPRGGAFDLRGIAPPFRGPNASPHQVQDFTDGKPDAGNLGNNTLPIDKEDLRRDKVQESSTDRSEPVGAVDPTESTMPVVGQQSIADGVPKDRSEDYPVVKDTSLIEKSPWVDGEFPADNLLRKDVDVVEQNANVLPDFGRTAEQDIGNEETGDKKDLLSSNDDTVKKSDVLPFMGENDPKPEDLNMEPPPELPNLGPVSTGPGESFDAKRSSLKPYPLNSESTEPRGTFDELGPRGMPFTPNIPPLLGNRGVDGRFPPFSPRGPSGLPFNPPASNLDQLRPRVPNDGQFNPRGPNDGPFTPRGPSDGQFPPRGSSDGPFAPRGSNDGPFPPRGSGDGPFAPRGSNDGPFAPRGPNDGPFAPRGPNDGPFAPRGPNDGPFAPRGPNDGPFAPRGSNEGQFRPQGPSNRQFDSRFANDTSRFDSRGSGDVQLNSSRGPNMAQPGVPGPNDRFPGPRRPNDALSYSRGPNENTFAPRGLLDSPFPKRGSKDGFFGPRGFNENQFDTSNDGHFGSSGGTDRYFGPRGPMSSPFAPRSNNEGQFNNKMQFGLRGPGDFRPRGQFDPNPFPKPSRDSLSGNRLSEPEGLDNRGDESLSDLGKNITLETDEKKEMEQIPNQDQPCSPAEVKSSEWRQPYPKNSFGDTDQRSGRDSGPIDKPPIGQNDMLNQSAAFSGEQRSSFTGNKSNTMTDKRSERSAIDSNSISTVRDFKSGYPGDLSLGNSEYDKFGGPNMFAKRSGDNRQSQARGRDIKEFCIEKQFNYNHGEGTVTDKKFTEHIPAKVIDYAHTTRSPKQDYLTPVQCFDYGHGNLKPTVTEREMLPKKDFRNWEENEQNLKEYTEKIRSYEHFAERSEPRRSVDYTERKIVEGLIDDRKYERERREKMDYKVKERREDRMYDRMSDKDHDNRYQSDRSKNKERTQERCETSQRDIHKEKGKDIDDRSKGNINWQDSSNKNKKETKPSDTSVPDNQHNVLESAPKTLDLPKTPNCTMVDDLLCPPGRQNRPPKIAVILRGPPGSGKSFVAKLIKDKEVEHGGSAPRILSLDDYFLAEKEVESKDDNGKKVIIKDMVYEYEEAMEQSYITSLVKAFKKNITDGFFNFIILDSINEKISDYDEMWSFAKTKGFKVYVCEMEMDLQICLKRNIHNRTEEEINRIIDYFEPTPSYHLKLDVNSMLQDQAIEEVHMEDTEEMEIEEKASPIDEEDSQDSQEDVQEAAGVSKWERMEAEDKLDRLDGLAKKKNEGKVQTMKDFLQVPDYYNMEDTSGKKRVRWADLEERKEQEKMRAVGFVVGHTNWDRMMDPTKGGSALTRTNYYATKKGKDRLVYRF